jgi:hypothetical protein
MSWYQMKGLARRNTHVKYESPSTNQSKVITKVKVFAEGRTDSDYYRASAISGSLNIAKRPVYSSTYSFSKPKVTEFHRLHEDC